MKRYFLLAALACGRLYAGDYYIPIDEERCIEHCSIKYLKNQPGPNYRYVELLTATSLLSGSASITLGATLCTLTTPEYKWDHTSTACSIGGGLGASLFGLCSLGAGVLSILEYFSHRKEAQEYEKFQNLAKLIEDSYNIASLESLENLNKVISAYRQSDRTASICAKDLAERVIKAAKAGYFCKPSGFINYKKLEGLLNDQKVPQAESYFEQCPWLGELLDFEIDQIITYLWGNAEYSLDILETKKKILDEAFKNYNQSVEQFLEDVKRADESLRD
jgi:hypothetical protein